MSMSYQLLGYGAFPYGAVPYGAEGRQAIVGSQFEVLRGDTPIGSQFQRIQSVASGSQFNVKEYNTDKLRILCDFASRGAEVLGGLNEWGNTQGAGLNWKASHTAPSSTNSFDISNVNSDLVEQVWRSPDTVKTGIVLDCDSELAQGIAIDTFALFGNLSTSATVRLVGSTVSNFASIGFDEQLGGTGSNDNEVVFIAETVPIATFKYWRLEIEDPTNPALFLEIGSILFGEATVFIRECFTDRVKIQKVNFTDEVETAGFTTVQNDRGIKKKLKLTFKNLDFELRNYNKMQDIFEDARTVLKCLWIPTPQDPKRYMLFGKLVKIPEETHNDKGPGKDYVDFNIEVDEAR